MVLRFPIEEAGARATKPAAMLQGNAVTLAVLEIVQLHGSARETARSQGELVADDFAVGLFDLQGADAAIVKS